jgi:transposase
MAAEVRPGYPSDWPTIVAVAGMLGIGSAETLREWVRQAEVDAGFATGREAAYPGRSPPRSQDLASAPAAHSGGRIHFQVLPVVQCRPYIKWVFNGG